MCLLIVYWAGLIRFIIFNTHSVKVAQVGGIKKKTLKQIKNMFHVLLSLFE